MSESRALQALLFAQTRVAERNTEDAAIYFHQEANHYRRRLKIFTSSSYIDLINEKLDASPWLEDSDSNYWTIQFSRILDASSIQESRRSRSYYTDISNPCGQSYPTIHFCESLEITFQYQSVLKRLYVTIQHKGPCMTRIGLPICKAPQLLEGLRFIFPTDEQGVVDGLADWIECFPR